MIEFRWVECDADDDGAMRRPEVNGDWQHAKLQFRTMQIWSIPYRGAETVHRERVILSVDPDEWGDWIDVGFEDVRGMVV